MLKTTDIAKSSSCNTLDMPHKGRVIANDDPSFKCRIKVEVPGILSGTTDDLPWVIPYVTAFMGNSKVADRVEIPEVGTEVTVMFPFGDPHQPFYTGRWHEFAVPDEFKTNYPHRYGFKDSTGVCFYVDKSTGEASFSMPNGFNVTVDKDGKFTMNTTKTTIKSDEEAVIDTPELHSTGEISDDVRTMSGDRVIYNGHGHPHGDPWVPSTPDKM